jgi:predicted porin
MDAKYETGPGFERKKRTSTLGVDWTVAGPHSIEAQWAHAWDTKGNDTGGGLLGTANLGGNGGVSIAGSDTGGDAISIAYRYRFSKRTSIKLGYIHVDNDTNTNTYRVGNTASVARGENSSAVAFHIRHRF